MAEDLMLLQVVRRRAAAAVPTLAMRGQIDDRG
jgi:hypothetical protein